MDLVFVFHSILAIFCALVLVCAISDFRSYRIPNILIILMAVFYPFYILAAPVPIAWGTSLLIAVVFFTIGAFLFKGGFMGGGDVKMICVCALWAGVNGLTIFIFFMGLSGAIMSLFMMSPFRGASAYVCGRFGFVNLQHKLMTPKLPYGVAIACGSLASIYFQFFAQV